MDREKYYGLMQAPEALDYELYLKTGSLLACQKPFDELCNRDELQFQVVHQVEELWMKLMAYTLLDVDDYLKAGETHRVVTLLGRCHRIMRMMTDQLDLLETMSPKEYQEIRLQLGNGSGQESPGFRILLKMVPELWRSFEQRYLVAEGRTVRSIYDEDYRHDAAYAVAEALIEFDELFGKFRWHHLFLIHRHGRSVAQRPLGGPVAGRRETPLLSRAVGRARRHDRRLGRSIWPRAGQHRP